MTNYLPFVVLILLVLLLVWFLRQGTSTEKLRESFFRNNGVPYRNLIGLVLGATASLLPLTSGAWTTAWATWVFVGALAVTMVLLVGVRPQMEKQVDRFAWGLLVIIVLGFGLGALIYQAKPWWIYLWHQYLKINNTGAILLEALFLLGVILGFFIVRNWAKEQKDFISSVSAVLSFAFLATILGKLQEGSAPAVNPLRAFALYALGFTMSGTLNLLAAARLTANYVNKRSITSRAILDFLYGEERANRIDSYFLKNFKADPDYAKAWLTDTLNQYRVLVAREFAERMEKRRQEREKSLADFISNQKGAGETIKSLTDKRRKMEPACLQLAALAEESEELNYEQDSLRALPEPRTNEQEERLNDIGQQLNVLEGKIEQLRKTCTDLDEWRTLTKRLKKLRPAYYYQLVAIECQENDADTDQPVSTPEKDREYNVICKYLGSDISGAPVGSGDKSPGLISPPLVTSDMFRVGIAARWQDMLEYITAPGEYRVSFPYFGSVSGLALLFRQTIIMDCDKYKRFRNKDHVDGVCPFEIEQPRGLDEIDFLSYIAIPIVNRLGTPTENGLGVVTIDTKLFVTPFQIEGHSINADEGIFRTRLRPSQLTEYAGDLYEPDDKDVRYVEDLTKIIAPVVELYNKCRVGAI